MATKSRRSGTPITGEEVARALGVSQSTISRAFSSSASISPATRERVIHAAQALGYHPNVIARSLMTRRTNIVAIVLANLLDPFYPQILDTLTQRIQARGRQTLLFVLEADRSVDETLSSLLQYQVDGIVLASATLSSSMARVCAARDTPVILFNRYVPGVKAGAVSCDNVSSGREVADYLFQSGHRKPVYVSAEAEATTSLDRRNGFLARWRELGVTDCGLAEGGAYTFEAGFDAGRAIVSEWGRPDCIFFASDILAIGGIHALKGAGLQIPDDVSVVGFDDVPLAAWPAIDLTTVRQPLAEMADAALDMLGLDGRRARGTPTTRMFGGTLVVRGTSRARIPMP